MPSNDDDTAAQGGGGPLSSVFKWLWNYPVHKLGVNALVFFVLTHVVVGVVSALVF